MNARTLGILLTIGSLTLVAFAINAMTGRVVEYHKTAEFSRYGMDPIAMREFTVHQGKPVSIQDATDEAGNALIEVAYEGNVARIPVRKPPAEDFQTLDLYSEWMKPLYCVEYTRDEETGARVKGQERFVIVSRHPAAGYDPETWGEVRRNDWTFTIAELMADGTVELSRFRWPRSEKAEKHMTLPEHLADLPPLEERTFEYQVALNVIPKLQMPKLRFKDTAVSAMGWTLPAASFGGLAALAGIALVLAPRRD